MSRVIVVASSAALCVAASFVACGESTGPDTRTLRGPDISVGAGLARTEIIVDASNRIRSIAAVFTTQALDDLPLASTEYILQLPADVPPSIFDHVGINWQPEGHPPPMVYTHPHFDVHFYMVSEEQRDVMTPADPAFVEKAMRAPDAAAVPPGYVADPIAIPGMGTHWADMNSHEFHGQLFTNTMIFGFYDGEMIFIEPMMTKAFLESQPNESKTIALPAQVPTPGAYPTTYRARHDAAAGEYRIELLDFETRN